MKRVLLILFAVLLCLSFAACRLPEGPGSESTDETTPVETEPVLPVSIIQDGATEYKIIRPENAAPALVTAVAKFCSDLGDVTGTRIKIDTDWYKKGNEPAEIEKEIVVGRCDRPGVDDIIKNLRERDFAIVYQNERIYILGGGDEATIEGINYFFSNYVDAAAKTVTVPNNLNYIERYEYPLGMVSVNGVNITEYRIVIPDGCGLYTSSAAECLFDYFYYNSGISLEIVKDTEAPSRNYEILVGDTNRAESKAASSVTLGADQYILACTGSKIVMTGNSYMVGGGVSEFINSYAASRGKNVDIDIKDLPAEYAPRTFAFKEAKNALLLIGDGMGFNHVQATLAAGLPEFVAEQLPNTGSCTTYSHSVTIGAAKYTDSAASATALATGKKTLNGYLGMDPNGKILKNVRELAASQGARTAILTTDTITGATPGAFLVHVSSRNSEAEIKAQIDELLKNKEVDYAVGSIGDDLVSEARHQLWSISAEGSRFFAMMEEAYIDKRSHDNNLQAMVEATTKYNKLIAYVVQFTLCHPDTALIVTADHETGGLTLDKNTGKYSYTSTSPTNADVLFYAIGEGTEVFKDKKIDNTDIAKFLGEIFGDPKIGN
ncbi:MAG: alkaline phosphatase [Clostridiales bacterium]|nr:alkaline phosphatase [Clostridiales bacterium]